MNLEETRKEIDNIDDEIISLLSKRQDLIKKIAEIKKELNKSVLDEKREGEIIEKLKIKAKENGLDANFVVSLYNIILENSRNQQEKWK
ncbi:MAG: chorismate mutase [Candidatus Woesearchaeota archaeon]|jgi:chorismate mutase|nr:chorismate mutase [Candidatus Woesearchaeota archaeon]MDP6265206.1 chorismate mutase [Candidatus Woesearchaeota archaeon]MDP7322941.1 chorismate mutase [Candidatus Woesearchaeota archaeon]MDP7476130.1 chorismate mutase [Candidatus Woesearchaeota archaeon]HJO02217.1 chorismate mutase [Candidatus Woesearchaeota archaeon]|tara:strand:+ start:4802 stop:5068 length:267 start_codon:yes stop_codon:yes gene_type:complete